MLYAELFLSQRCSNFVVSDRMPCRRLPQTVHSPETGSAVCQILEYRQRKKPGVSRAFLTYDAKLAGRSSNRLSNGDQFAEPRLPPLPPLVLNVTLPIPFASPDPTPSTIRYPGPSIITWSFGAL